MPLKTEQRARALAQVTGVSGVELAEWQRHDEGYTGYKGMALAKRLVDSRFRQIDYYPASLPLAAVRAFT